MTPVRAAYLFGSHLTGMADTFSDIDIAAFIEGIEDRELSDRVRLIVEVQRQVGDDIELHLFPASEWPHPHPASFAAFVISHGIKLPVQPDL